MSSSLAVVIVALLLVAYSLGWYLGYTSASPRGKAKFIEPSKKVEKGGTIKNNKVEFASPVSPEQAFKDSKTLDEFIQKNKI